MIPIRTVTLTVAVSVCTVLFAAPTRAKPGGCPSATKKTQHVVARGQVLSTIASSHGVRISELVRDNPGLNADAIREGQKLVVCIPRPARRERCPGGGRIYQHKVGGGESLEKIAARYRVKEKDLLQRNPKLAARPDRVRAGDTLTVCAKPARARAAKACNFRSPLHKHEVVPGEWLAEIASRYGVRQKDILRLNDKLRRNPDFLRTGQKIRVCPDIAPRKRVRIRHIVQQGDTVVSIAKHYDLHPRQLLRFQEGRLSNPDRLRLGQHLVVWKDGSTVGGFGHDGRGTGALAGGIRLPRSPHYTMKNPKLAWGTANTIEMLQRATSRYRKRVRRAATIHIGDLSRRGGGKFPPHRSHRTGEDADVGYAHRGKWAGAHRFVRATRDNLDVPKTWALIRSFLSTGHVRYVFMDYYIQRWLYEYAKARGTRQGMLDELFQYPRGRGRAYGIIRAEPGHDDHFHVRFQ